MPLVRLENRVSRHHQQVASNDLPHRELCWMKHIAPPICRTLQLLSIRGVSKPQQTFSFPGGYHPACHTMLAGLHLSLLLLVSSTAARNHSSSHSAAFQGRPYMEHYSKGHHASHAVGSSHQDAEHALDKEDSKHGKLAGPHKGNILLHAALHPGVSPASFMSDVCKHMCLMLCSARHQERV